MHSHVQLFWNPMDCSPLGSTVHGILLARILECVAFSSSKGSSWSRGQTHVSCISCTGSRILYNCTMWEVHCHPHLILKVTPRPSETKIPWIERIPRWVHGTEYFCVPQGMHHAKNDRTVCCPNTYVVCPDTSLALHFAWTSIYEECSLTFTKRNKCVQ